MVQVNVLIVDDRPENLLAFESTLSGLGSHLEFVTSAEHALRYLLTNEVALILLDVQMPGVNGFELAELIRDLTASSSPIEFVPRPQDDPKVRQPDITFARTALSWEPVVDVEEGLRRTIDWFRQQTDLRQLTGLRSPAA